eukprot:3851185-Rhodomonas_salina.1
MFLRAAGPRSMYVKPSSNEPRKYCSTYGARLLTNKEFVTSALNLRVTPGPGPPAPARGPGGR